MCTRPLLGMPCGLTEKGKVKYRIISYQGSKELFESGTEPYTPDDNLDRRSMRYKTGNILLLPCGKCPECKLQYAKKWSDRCMLELQQHESAYFLTLTYDSEHLPKNDKGIATLCKKDFQDFMKRLRQSIHRHNKKHNIPDYQIRYYMCGEYGSKTFRPHYHAIIFSLYLHDLVFYRRSESGEDVFTSQYLDSVWQNGQVFVGSVTPRSCSYVARYVNKKAHDDRQKYVQLNIVPEYTNMSTHPGIGADSYTPDIFRKGYLCLSTEKGGIKVYPNRYYETKFEKEFPDEYEAYKQKKALNAELSSYAGILSTSKDFESRLQTKEDILVARTSSLIRPLD